MDPSKRKPNESMNGVAGGREGLCTERASSDQKSLN
jgi:hypothetical protein